MPPTIDEQPQPEAMSSQPGHQEENSTPLKEKLEAGGNAPNAAPTPRPYDGERKQRRSFCSPILIFFSALGSLFAGMVGFSAQGMSKFYWHIPILYGDTTTREWPEITGFGSGCAAGGKVRTIYFRCNYHHDRR